MFSCCLLWRCATTEWTTYQIAERCHISSPACLQSELNRPMGDNSKQIHICFIFFKPCSRLNVKRRFLLSRKTPRRLLGWSALRLVRRRLSRVTMRPRDVSGWMVTPSGGPSVPLPAPSSGSEIPICPVLLVYEQNTCEITGFPISLRTSRLYSNLTVRFNWAQVQLNRGS